MYKVCENMFVARRKKSLGITVIDNCAIGVLSLLNNCHQSVLLKSTVNNCIAVILQDNSQPYRLNALLITVALLSI